MERVVIPICKKHGRFQTENHRWLNISQDLEEHIAYTKSHDAILSEGECDLCFNPNQTELNIGIREIEYCSKHDLFKSLSGNWLNASKFLKIHNETEKIKEYTLVETKCSRC